MVFLPLSFYAGGSLYPGLSADHAVLSAAGTYPEADPRQKEISRAWHYPSAFSAGSGGTVDRSAVRRQAAGRAAGFLYAGGTAAGVLLSQMLRRAGREVRLGRAADRDVSDRADDGGHGKRADTGGAADFILLLQLLQGNLCGGWVSGDHVHCGIFDGKGICGAGGTAQEIPGTESRLVRGGRGPVLYHYFYQGAGSDPAHYQHFVRHRAGYRRDSRRHSVWAAGGIPGYAALYRYGNRAGAVVCLAAAERGICADGGMSDSVRRVHCDQRTAGAEADR